MIQEMESVTLDTLGPIGNCRNRFRGIWFTDYGAGPFPTLQALEDWCNHKLEICETYKRAVEGTPKFQFQTLVFTHQDIALRNLILDSSGRVWMIDWANAGAYPPGFEQAALEQQHLNLDFNKEVSSKITSYLVICMQLGSIRYGLSTAALA